MECTFILFFYYFNPSAHLKQKTRISKITIASIAACRIGQKRQTNAEKKYLIFGQNPSFCFDKAFYFLRLKKKNDPQKIAQEKHENKILNNVAREHVRRQIDCFVK